MTDIVVRPTRFTDNIEPMRAFLELLGLRPRLESERGGWVELVADGGIVALHSAASSDSGAMQGYTALAFEAADLDPLAQALIDAAVPDVTVYDEAYGRVLTFTDPLGDTLAIDEPMTDLYGYRTLPGGKPVGPKVMPVRFCDPAGPYGHLLQVLGLRPVGKINEYYVNFAAADGEHGLVGLHYVFAGDLPIVPGSGSVQLTFQSAEPLRQIADRLIGGGFAPELHEENFGTLLSVTDPDGQPVQVHEPSTNGSASA
jgi:hypothetical protein